MASCGDDLPSNCFVLFFSKPPPLHAINKVRLYCDYTQVGEITFLMKTSIEFYQSGESPRLDLAWTRFHLINAKKLLKELLKLEVSKRQSIYVSPVESVL